MWGRCARPKVLSDVAGRDSRGTNILELCGLAMQANSLCSCSSKLGLPNYLTRFLLPPFPAIWVRPTTPPGFPTTRLRGLLRPVLPRRMLSSKRLSGHLPRNEGGVQRGLRQPSGSRLLLVWEISFSLHQGGSKERHATCLPALIATVRPSASQVLKSSVHSARRSLSPACQSTLSRTEC